MAVASAWAKPGSWALDAESHEESPADLPPVMNPAAADADTADFPTLATATATKVPKKKKQQQPIPLADFNSGKFVAPGSRSTSSDQLLLLPTGPRERSAEELESVPRGFGGYRGGSESRWDKGQGQGQSRNSEEPRRNGSGDSNNSSRDFAPSRADEVDDWGAGKKTAVAQTERRERSGGFGDSHSRADEIDDWGANKKPVVTTERRERSGGFGDSHSRADESVNWVANKSYVAPLPPAESRRSTAGWGFDREGGPDSANWGKKRAEAGSGDVSSSSRPRLVLQPRTLPLAIVSDGEKEKQEIAPKSKSANPFGAARPREEVLAAKGEDWRKIDEKVEATKAQALPPERKSFGRRGSGVDNRNGYSPEKHNERAWRKGEAAEAPVEIAEGPAASDSSDIAEESA